MSDVDQTRYLPSAPDPDDCKLASLTTAGNGPCARAFQSRYPQHRTRESRQRDARQVIIPQKISQKNSGEFNLHIALAKPHRGKTMHGLARLGRSPLYFSGDRPTFIAEKRSAILFGFSNGGSADCAAI